MKYFSFAMLLLIAGVGRADDPTELSMLRQSWTKARDQATAPIDKKYSDALEQMKIRLMKAGNLQGALAVDAELHKLTKPPTITTPEDAETTIPIIGTAWHGLKGSNPKMLDKAVHFRDAGVISVKHDDPQLKDYESWTWRTDEKGRIFIKCGADEVESRFKLTKKATHAEFIWSRGKCEVELTQK